MKRLPRLIDDKCTRQDGTRWVARKPFGANVPVWALYDREKLRISLARYNPALRSVQKQRCGL